MKLTSSAQGEEVWAFHEVAARWIIEEFGGDLRLRSETFIENKLKSTVQ